MRQITGNKLLVRALKEEGVDTIFGYPGACTIDISDELGRQDDIKIILPRHEQALVHEADAYARTTGKVGVCLVTSGPGATNLVTGLATANYDSVPLVCFTGQVARHLIGPGSGYRRHYPQHHKVRRDGAEPRGPGADHQRSILHRPDGTAGTGAH